MTNLVLGDDLKEEIGEAVAVESDAPKEDAPVDDLQTKEGTDETPVDNVDTASDEEPETFPKAYVEKLRKEAADHRVKAKKVDDYAQRLHKTLVESSGRLADPTDLPFDEAHLDDPEALTAAIDALLEAKPHLASRTPRGDIGQGVNVPEQDTFSLAGWLRGA